MALGSEAITSKCRQMEFAHIHCQQQRLHPLLAALSERQNKPVILPHFMTGFSLVLLGKSQRPQWKANDSFTDRITNEKITDLYTLQLLFPLPHLSFPLQSAGAAPKASNTLWFAKIMASWLLLQQSGVRCRHTLPAGTCSRIYPIHILGQWLCCGSGEEQTEQSKNISIYIGLFISGSWQSTKSLGCHVVFIKSLLFTQDFNILKC